MNYRSGVATGVAATAIVAVFAVGIVWLLFGSPLEALKPSLPKTEATVAKPANEGQFNTVILSADAEKKLGLARGVAKREKTTRTRFYGGDVVIPPNQTIVVSAPVSGMVKPAASDKPLPKVGQSVEAGQAVLQLLPLLTPEGRATLAQARVDAEGVEKKAKIDEEGAKVALDRASTLLADKTGSQRIVDEARVTYEGMAKVHEAAVERTKLLARVTGESESGTTTPIALGSPGKGFLRNLSVVAGQYVPAGAALFEVVDDRTVWVKVPVYVGDLPDLDLAQAARIGNLSRRAKETPLEAKPVMAPPSANALAGTVDVFYELDNAVARYSPGHRVGVTIPVKGEAESLTVPWGAVVHDLNGGTWVYEQSAEHTYIRRRVSVVRSDGETAVLKEGTARPDSAKGAPEGLKSGAVVVTAGTVELFGTETGYSK